MDLTISDVYNRCLKLCEIINILTLKVTIGNVIPLNPFSKCIKSGSVSFKPIFEFQLPTVRM